MTPREALYNRLESRNAQSTEDQEESRHLSLFPNVILYGEKPRRPSKAMLHESSYLRAATLHNPADAPDRIEMTPFGQMGTPPR